MVFIVNASLARLDATYCRATQQLRHVLIEQERQFVEQERRVVASAQAKKLCQTVENFADAVVFAKAEVVVSLRNEQRFLELLRQSIGAVARLDFAAPVASQAAIKGKQTFIPRLKKSPPKTAPIVATASALTLYNPDKVQMTRITAYCNGEISAEEAMQQSEVAIQRYQAVEKSLKELCELQKNIVWERGKITVLDALNDIRTSLKGMGDRKAWELLLKALPPVLGQAIILCYEGKTDDFYAIVSGGEAKTALAQLNDYFLRQQQALALNFQQLHQESLNAQVTLNNIEIKMYAFLEMLHKMPEGNQNSEEIINGAIHSLEGLITKIEQRSFGYVEVNLTRDGAEFSTKEYTR